MTGVAFMRAVEGYCVWTGAAVLALMVQPRERRAPYKVSPIVEHVRGYARVCYRTQPPAPLCIEAARHFGLALVYDVDADELHAPEGAAEGW